MVDDSQADDSKLDLVTDEELTQDLHFWLCGSFGSNVLHSLQF